MKTNLKIVLASVIAVVSCLGSNTSSAALLAYDGYDGGTVVNGGTGWQANWTVSDNVLGTNLSSGNGLVTTGGSATVGWFGNGQALRRFSAAPINTGTLWISWLQTSNTVAGNPTQLRILNGSNVLLMFGKHFNNTTDWAIMSDGGGSIQSASGVGMTGTQFLTASMEFSTGQVNLYVNPTGLGAGLAPAAGLAASWTSGLHFSSGFDRIVTTAETATMNVDEFRVGTTWQDVSPIPEPSTYALLGLGLAALVFLRRRKVA